MTRQDKKFPFLLGFIDGILTALTLSTGKLWQEGAVFDFNLAVRVSIAALVSGGFVFFVAKYAELRGQLIQAEKELNLSSSGKLASTALGKKVLYSTIVDSVISGVSGFIGAFLPLLIAILDPYSPWGTLIFSVGVLGIFGFVLGKTVGRQPWIWTIALMLGGVFVILIGIKLHIVS